MWIKTPHEVMHPHKMSVSHSEIKHQGIYIFGGYNQHRECTTNALYILKPCYQGMKKQMSAKIPNFKRLVKPKYTFELAEIKSMGGKAPSPRFSHSACMIGGKYLVIYGGRNDKMFN